MIQERQLVERDGRKALLILFLSHPFQVQVLLALCSLVLVLLINGTTIVEEHLQVAQVAQEMPMVVAVGIICILKVRLQTIPLLLAFIGLE